MGNQSLRDTLLAKRAEIEAALRELDRIEELAGLRSPPPPSINGKSYSQAVLDSITRKQKSIDELSDELGITADQVVNAIQSHRLRRFVTSRVLPDGRRVYFPQPSYLRAQESAAKSPKLTDAIVAALANNPGVAMRTSDVVRRLEGLVDTTAKNFHASVATTLSTLAKLERVRRVGPGQYSAIASE